MVSLGGSGSRQAVHVAVVAVLVALVLSSCGSGRDGVAVALTGPTMSAEKALGVHPDGVSMVPSRAGVLVAATGSHRTPRLARCDIRSRCQLLGGGDLAGASVSLRGATADGGPILLARRCSVEGPDCAADEFAVQVIDDGSDPPSISRARWFRSTTVAGRGGAEESLQAQVWRVGPDRAVVVLSGLADGGVVLWVDLRSGRVVREMALAASGDARRSDGSLVLSRSGGDLWVQPDGTVEPVDGGPRGERRFASVNLPGSLLGPPSASCAGDPDAATGVSASYDDGRNRSGVGVGFVAGDQPGTRKIELDGLVGVAEACHHDGNLFVVLGWRERPGPAHLELRVFDT